MSATPRSTLAIVFLVVFIDLLGFGIVLPLLPLYADNLLKPLFPEPALEPLRGVMLGLLMSSFSVMQFVFAPIWGGLSDRVGRRPILLMGLASSAVFYAVFGVASELGAHGWLRLGLILLFIARLGAGIAGATISTAQAVIADCTPPEGRARGMALIGAAFGIGFTFGPLLGFASRFLPSAGAPGFLAAGISFAALCLAALKLPETLRIGHVHGRRRVFEWGVTLDVLRAPSVGLLILSFFLATLAFSGLESTLALVNKALWPGTDTVAPELEQGNFLVFAYTGMVLMVVQGLVYRRLVPRVGELRFLRVGAMLMTAGLVGAAVVLLIRGGSTSERAIFAFALVVMTVAVTGFAFVTPSVQALISRRSDPSRQGEILGVNQSVSALARILGPMLALTLFALTPSHVLPFAFGALLMAIMFSITLRIPADDDRQAKGTAP
jgi:MFS family permease